MSCCFQPVCCSLFSISSWRSLIHPIISLFLAKNEGIRTRECTMREISRLLDFPNSTVIDDIKRFEKTVLIRVYGVSKAIRERMANFIRVPSSPEEWLSIAKDFERRTCLSNWLGAIGRLLKSVFSQIPSCGFFRLHSEGVGSNPGCEHFFLLHLVSAKMSRELFFRT